MTLCFVSDYYPTLPVFGGIALYTQRIARALAQRGHQVHIVVAKAGEGKNFDDEGVHVHFCATRWLPGIGRWLPGLGESLGIARVLARLHREHHFDLVEIPNWEGIGFAPVWIPGLKVVIRLHTSLAESIETAGRPPTPPERFMIWMERTSTRRAHAVVTHSIAHRDRMAAAYGLSPDPIVVIPHGVPMPAQVSPPEGTVVLSIGRMTARKGMDTLFAAIPSILERVPGARFQIVGVTPDHEAMRALTQRCPGAVEALGVVDSVRLSELYNRCAIYVSPATYESFGLTFAEAMAHGRPVVGCAVSAVPEIVRTGIDGLLVPPRDADALAGAIVELLRDEGLLRRMGAAARQRAMEHYSLDTAVARCEEFFARVQS